MQVSEWAETRGCYLDAGCRSGVREIIHNSRVCISYEEKN